MSFSFSTTNSSFFYSQRRMLEEDIGESKRYRDKAHDLSFPTILGACSERRRNTWRSDGQIKVLQNIYFSLDKTNRTNFDYQRAEPVSIEPPEYRELYAPIRVWNTPLYVERYARSTRRSLDTLPTNRCRKPSTGHVYACVWYLRDGIWHALSFVLLLAGWLDEFS